MTAATIDDILHRLHDVHKVKGGGWKARCPAHDDANPSLSVKVGDAERVLLHCFAGCEYADIMAALGFSANGNGRGPTTATPATPKPTAPKPTQPARRIVATYNYCDAAGQVIFQKVRYEPKSFAQRRPDGRGGYTWGLGDVAPVLYRLPELIDPATSWQSVYICEGEQDVDRVAGLGLVATCNFDGASAAGQKPKWRPEYNQHFAGRVVYILADNDEPGRAHAENVARNLHGMAQAVKVINLPGLPPKGDVSDWLNAGNTKDDLERVCLLTPLWEPATDNAADDLAQPPAPSPVAFKLDDTGNAERFVAQHGDDVRYDHSTGHWYIWAGTHWRRDDDGAIQRRGKTTTPAIYDEAAAAARAGNDDLAAQLAKWARASAAESRRNAMLNLARAELPIAITHDRLNTHDLLVNVQNGTIDLATGTIRPHDRRDLLTYVLPVAYDPTAGCPTWVNFLWRITNDDDDLADFLARAVGYTLSGLTTEQCLFFLHGRGANGKSTFVETVMALLGDLGHKARAQVLMLSERERVSNEVAALAGRRLVVTSELSDGGRLDEGLVKDLTGGDTMSARFLYGEPFTFRPTFKLWLYGNHKPTIAGTDDGIWRRVRLIPFTVQIPEKERDATLPAKLRAELPGLLTWALRGWQDFQRHGLGTPAAVTQATAEYRSESDVMGIFLEERCRLHDGATAEAGKLYAAYCEWATENGLRPMSNVRFAKSLSERGFAKDKNTANGRMEYQNIWLPG